MYKTIIEKLTSKFPFGGFRGLFLLSFITINSHAQTFENQFAKPLGNVLREIGARFDVNLKFDVDTAGKVVTFADFRIRPYSVEESLSNVLSLFDYKAVKQDDKTYKIKAYEYPRRTPADGKKMLAYLDTLYPDSATWNARKACLKKEVREKLQIDSVLKKRVQSKPILSKVRKFDGYSVQNIALETLPGLYVCGSVYTPAGKGKHAVILCPNGHWADGRITPTNSTGLRPWHEWALSASVTICLAGANRSYRLPARPTAPRLPRSFKL
jgi:hypothetical protein